MIRRTGVTLMEVLVVVAILGIVVAIAVPNFLAGQTRAKVSRALNDLRVAELALEYYRIDTGGYPRHRGQGIRGFGESAPEHVNDGYGNPRVAGFRTLPLRLSTPIAYLTSVALGDPFKRGAVDPVANMSYESGDPTDLSYVYHNIYQFAILEMAPDFFPDDFTDDYGHWRILSLGPSMVYGGLGDEDRGWLYDPTNGHASRGMIVRTQKDVRGEHLAHPDAVEPQ